jgi:polyisoprenoid-binding protein YceI
MSTLTAAKTAWVIDSSHSEISFKAKHLVITTVTGRFQEFSGTVETVSEDFRGAQIEFTAKVNSLTTGSEHRDNHLKSADFFDAASFPEIRFVSTDFVKKSENEYELTGNLTIKDVSKVVKLEVAYEGTHKDPFYGKTKAGFELNGKIARKDFGLTWDVLTEAGGAVVSNDIKIHINVQLDRIDA